MNTELACVSAHTARLQMTRSHSSFQRGVKLIARVLDITLSRPKVVLEKDCLEHFRVSANNRETSARKVN